MGEEEERGRVVITGGGWRRMLYIRYEIVSHHVGGNIGGSQSFFSGFDQIKRP